MVALFKKFIPWLTLLAMTAYLPSCSKDEEDIRMPEDITGIWSPSDNYYLEFGADYTVHNLEIEHQDGESIGLWNNDAYLYEPGYHIVIYLTGIQADVFQIVDLTSQQMTWCWVDKIEIDTSVGKDTIGHLVGDVIKKAQEGYHLNPELYQSFRKISQDEFFSILESLDIMYPW